VELLEGESFSTCQSLTSIFNDKITEIPTKCFYACKSLQYAVFPNAAIVNESAFDNCPQLITEFDENKMKPIQIPK
jgi:hypothetical protein